MIHQWNINRYQLLFKKNSVINMIFLYRLFGKDTKIQVLESKIKYFLITTWFSADPPGRLLLQK